MPALLMSRAVGCAAGQRSRACMTRYSISKSTVSSIRILRRIPVRRSGSAAAARAGSRSRNASRPRPDSSIACTINSGRASGLRRNSRAAIRISSSGRSSMRSHAGSRPAGSCSTSGRTPADSCTWQAGRAGSPRGSSSTRARRHLLPPVYSVNVDSLVLCGRAYGAVTLIDVLEHVPHPVALLSKVYDALEIGAWVVVKVPSGPAQRQKESARALLRRGYRPRLADNLVHVNHFSPGSLRRALERAGFTDVAIAIGPPEIPPASGAMGALANLVRRSIYYAGRLVPGGLDTPLALNLLAYARRSS